MYTQASCLGLCSEDFQCVFSSELISLHLLTSPLPGGEDEGDGEGLCSQDPQQVGNAQETSGQHQSHSQFHLALFHSHSMFSIGLIPMLILIILRP